MNLKKLIEERISKDINDDIIYLICEVLDKSRSEVNYLLNEEYDNRDLLAKIEDYVKSDLPVQYYLGYAYFYGMKLKVSKDTLIPRFDTEELVERVLNRLDKNKEYKILDLCCGTGAIGLSIKKELPKNIVYCSDISKKALEICEINKNNLKLDIRIIETDLLNYFIDNNIKFDCIISNPPYISYNSKEVEEKVRKYEPKLALFAEDDGYEMYERILKQVKNCLNEHYILAFEHGYEQKNRLIQMIKNYLGEVKINSYQDLSGNDRIIIVEQ